METSIVRRGEAPATAVAYRAIWLAVVFDFLAFGIGVERDRRRHTTRALDDFLSPPHIFVYVMHLLATLTLAYVVFTPPPRAGVGTAYPAVTGVVDLALRARAP